MAPVVNCNVANCSFWTEGNKCGADEILVEIDAHERSFDTEASEELYGAAIEFADKSEETCCHTFKPKK